MPKSTKARVARISRKPVSARKVYPFASTPLGQSFTENDVSQWARLRVSASRYNKKNGTNFVVTAEKEGERIIRLRCGIPVSA